MIKKKILNYVLVFFMLLLGVSGQIFNNTFNATDPSLQLINGSIMFNSSTEFEATINITTGISDDDPATSYFTTIGGLPVPRRDIIDAWSFNDLIEPGSDTLHSFFGQNNGIITGTIDPVAYPVESNLFYGGYFDAAGDYITIADSDVFDIADLGNHTICIHINTTASFGTERGIMVKRTTGQGYWFVQRATQVLRCRYQGNTGGVTLDSPSIIADGVIHIACCRKTGDTLDLFVDGDNVATGSANIGSVSNAFNLHFGSKNNGGSQWSGTILAAAIINDSLSDSVIKQQNESLVIINKGTAIQVFFNHPIDLDEEYFLKVVTNITDSSTVRVNTYTNMTDVNSTNYDDYTLVVGENFLPITNDSLVLPGYNYPFRLVSLTGNADTAFQEVFLQESINDTQPPSINNVYFNDTNLTCNDSVTVFANITDNVEVQNAFYTWDINGTRQRYQFGRNTLFFDAHTPSELESVVIQSGYGFNGSLLNISIIQVNATDLANNINITNLSLNEVVAYYTCNVPPCFEDWVQDLFVCTVYDNGTIIYTDQNDCGTIDNLPGDNGTIQSCNHCSQDIVNDTSICLNNILTIDFTDLNFTTCCAVTNLTSDCEILNQTKFGNISRTCEEATSTALSRELLRISNIAIGLILLIAGLVILHYATTFEIMVVDILLFLASLVVFNLAEFQIMVYLCLGLALIAAFKTLKIYQSKDPKKDRLNSYFDE